MNVTIDELISLTGGAFFLTLGIGKLNERRKLLRIGVKAEGVVFSVEYERSSDNSRGIYYPVVRYKTTENEWVTKQYGIGSSPSAYTEGDEVNIVYDITDSKHFIIDNWQTKLFGPLMMIIGILLIVGVFIYHILYQL